MASHKIKNSTEKTLRYPVTMTAGNIDRTVNVSATQTVDVPGGGETTLEFEGVVVKSVSVSGGTPAHPGQPSDAD